MFVTAIPSEAGEAGGLKLGCIYVGDGNEFEGLG